MRFFDDMCKVSRNVIEVGQYNNPTSSIKVIGDYRCMLSRKGNTINVYQANPQTYVSSYMKLYAEPKANIVAGDIVEVQGLKFRAGLPYKLRTHMEIDLSYMEEI